MHCNQCQMLSINGVPCHETGCPNAKKVWRDGEWVKTFSCIDCGSEYEDEDEAYNCCASVEDDEEDLEEYEEFPEFPSPED